MDPWPDAGAPLLAPAAGAHYIYGRRPYRDVVWGVAYAALTIFTVAGGLLALHRGWVRVGGRGGVAGSWAPCQHMAPPACGVVAMAIPLPGGTTRRHCVRITHQAPSDAGACARPLRTILTCPPL